MSSALDRLHKLSPLLDLAIVHSVSRVPISRRVLFELELIDRVHSSGARRCRGDRSGNRNLDRLGQLQDCARTGAIIHQMKAVKKQCAMPCYGTDVAAVQIRLRQLQAASIRGRTSRTTE